MAVQATRTQVLLPHCVALQWDAAVAWQILYHLAASPVTSVPTLRYLRGNHDLVQRHLTTGLTSASLLQATASTETTVGNSEDISDTARGNMKPAEEMRGPEWMSDFSSDESKLLERLIVACEENCILVSAEDRLNLGSSLINSPTLHSRLRFLLPLLQTNFSGFRSSPADLSDSLITEVVAFAHRRNMYRLCLSAGKQACLEGWRQVAELGMHRFKVLNKLNLMTSPPVTDVRTSSSSLLEVSQATASTAPRDHVFTISMSLLSSIL
ncbi:unnamed protein product, partial [Dibothriocephalus latus]